MKMTFTLPDDLPRQSLSAYPEERRSRVVAGLLSKRLGVDDESLAKACWGANSLKQVERNMEDCERPNLRGQ